MSKPQPVGEEDPCVVCCKRARFYSIGPCDHPVCYECSTRLRVVCNKLECPICRYVMQEVVFCREVRPFADVAKLRTVSQEHDHGIRFLTWDVHKAYHKLLDNQCSACGIKYRSFGQLRDHMRKEHELFYCDLCVQNLMIFPFERKCYNRTDLATHRRKGDLDDTSHKGHPMCKFCDERFMDNDHLYRHLRREHLYCHFCDADGKYYFFRNYDELRGHFLEDHFLCEQGLCKNDMLTSVFRTDIDLKAHIATAHSKQLGRAGARQARLLELEFNFHPRREPDETDFNHAIGERSRGHRGGGRGRLADVAFEETPPTHVGPAAPLTAADFPALAGGNDVAPGGASNASNAGLTFTSRLARQRFTDDEFPSLGGGPSTATGAVRRAPRDITITSSAGTNNRSRPALGNGNSAQSLKMNQQNFPTLHAETASGNSTVKLTVAPHPQAAQPAANLSIRVNHGGSNVTSSTSIHVRPKSTAEAFPALGNGSASVVPETKQWVAAKPKKQHQHEQKTSKVAKAPVLPPPSLQDFPSLGRKVEKKSAGVTMPIAADGKSKGDNNNSDVAQTNGTTVRKDRNQNQHPNQNGKNKKEKKAEQDATNANNATNRHKHKHAADQTGVDDVASDDGVVKKTSTLKIGTLVSQSPNETTAPPGFALKPPPGFGAGSNLTFTNSSGQSYNIGPSDASPASHADGADRPYHQPPNFQNRNAALIRQCVKLLKTQECVNEFKSYSGLFRQGDYPAEKYYEHCCTVLGGEFNALFPELLVLLPDIDKQQELYKIHKQCGSARGLQVCGTCNQVIFAVELKQHVDSHFMENHFPGLWPDGQVGRGSAWRK